MAHTMASWFFASAAERLKLMFLNKRRREVDPPLLRRSFNTVYTRV